LPSGFPSDSGNNTYRLAVSSAVARLSGVFWENERLALPIDGSIIVEKIR